jgi:prepilin signal peptidase PulO-like enzyme (type II secretory pathway)
MFMIYPYVLLFTFGLFFGSFFSVLILRYGESKKFFDLKKISGRSRCPKCLHALSAKDLIPLFSFFYLGGRCAYCREKISFFYPFLEILSGFVFSGTPFFLNRFYGISDAYFWFGRANLEYYFLIFLWLLVFISLLLIAMIDIRYYLIPNGLNLFLFVLGLILTFSLFYYSEKLQPFKYSFLENYALIFSPTQNIILSHFLGSFLGGLFFFLLVFFTGGKGIGWGDVKLALSLGMVFGLPDIALSIIAAFIFGGIVSLMFILLGIKKMKDKVPYAPFFLIGVLFTVLWGKEFISLYFNFFGL